jgi:MFS family permease
MLGNLFPVLAVEYAGLSEAQAGLLYLITPALAFTGPLFGWLTDRTDHRLVLSIRSASNVVSSLLYLFLPAFPGFLVGKGLDDLGKAAFSPAWGSLMAHVSSSDRRKRARIMSVLSVGEDTGDIVAPILAGVLWSTYGVAAVLGARVALAIASEIYALRVTAQLDRPSTRSESSCRTGLDVESSTGFPPAWTAPTLGSPGHSPRGEAVLCPDVGRGG